MTINVVVFRNLRTLVEKIERGDWDRFACSNKKSTMFHTSAWREVLVRQGFEPVYLAAIDNGGRIDAVYRSSLQR